MGSFSCPNYDSANEWCLRLKTDCVIGRPGCVVVGKAGFAVPVEERIRLKAEEKMKQARVKKGVKR